MSIMLMIAANLVAPAIADHRVEVMHVGRPVQASYRPNVVIAARQVGMAAPGGRQGSQRCVWTATVEVERALPNGARRSLAETREIGGSRHGSCMTARRAISQEVAARAPELSDHVTAIAANDHPVLLSELETARTMAVD